MNTNQLAIFTSFVPISISDRVKVNANQEEGNSLNNCSSL